MKNTAYGRKRLRYCLFIILHLSFIISFTSCLSTKRLEGNKHLLTAQNVRGSESLPADELESLLPQKPNRRLLGLPITPALWFYRFGQQSYDRETAIRNLAEKTAEFDRLSEQLTDSANVSDDTDANLRKLNRRYGRKLNRLRLRAEEGNWWMRSLGEPPSYFSEADARANAVKIREYAANKGFLNAEATYRLDTLLRRQIRVNYLVTENDPFFVRTVTYEIADPRIDSLVRQSLDKSVLRTGTRFDIDNLAAERVRIESLLRDRGYYGFSRQYVRATDVDTTRRFMRVPGRDSSQRSLDLYVQILNPPGKTAHPIYTFGGVTVRVDGNTDVGVVPVPAFAGLSDTTRRNGIAYLLNGRDISTRLLDSKIRIRPGTLYSQFDYRNTQRQLFLLNQFKFVNVNFTDTTNRRLQTLITVSPLDKYEYTFEGGLFVLYQNQSSYPGPFANLTFRVRNLFGGLETLETSVRYGFEFQTGFNTSVSSRPYRATEIGVTTSLIFPQILFPGRFRFRFSPYAPRTQVGLGFTNTRRPDFQRSLLRATMAYNWQTSPARQFSFFIADINLINAGRGAIDTISNQFQEQLDRDQQNGGTLFRSFRRSFASGISMAYTYNTNVIGQNRRANFLRAVAESGGTTLNLFSNQQLQQIFNPQGTDSTGLQYYKYLRVNVDYRHYVPLRPRTTLAFRVNAGLVYGYGPNGGPAPYEKLFFAGGSNSIRAWLPRRLGPGSAYPQISSDDPGKPATSPEDGREGQFLYTFEKPGDLLIEGSAELRGRLFKLVADVDGAFFIDVGNVWQLPGKGSAPGSEFRFSSFVPQIAVGTGVGLRLNFSFIIIRFDGGIKVWDPARQYYNSEGNFVDERFILPEFSLSRLSKGKNPLVVNFGIGYPF